MTDIVERLQERYHETAEPECDLLQEAADEIERLRDERDVLLMALKSIAWEKYTPASEAALAAIANSRPKI